MQYSKSQDNRLVTETCSLRDQDRDETWNLRDRDSQKWVSRRFSRPRPILETLSLLNSYIYFCIGNIIGIPRDNLLHMQGRNEVKLRPGQETFGARMFEFELFRKKIYCIAESTCDIFWIFGAPHSDSAPGICTPLHSLVTPLCFVLSLHSVI